MHLIQRRNNEIRLGVEPLLLRLWLLQKQRFEPLHHTADFYKTPACDWMWHINKIVVLAVGKTEIIRICSKQQ